MRFTNPTGYAHRPMSDELSSRGEGGATVASPDVVGTIGVVAVAVVSLMFAGALFVFFGTDTGNVFEIGELRHRFSNSARLFANPTSGFVLLGATALLVGTRRRQPLDEDRLLLALSILSAAVILVAGALIALDLTADHTGFAVMFGFTVASTLTGLILAAASFWLAWSAGQDRFWKRLRGSRAASAI